MALVSPLTLAVNCLLVPTVSRARLVNVATPLPAAVPMSRVVVPSSEPAPEVNDKARLLLTPNPEAESFPNASRVRSTGWGARGEPTTALPGWVRKTSVAAGAGLTTIAVEVVDVKPELVKRIVMLVATRSEEHTSEL